MRLICSRSNRSECKGTSNGAVQHMTCFAVCVSRARLHGNFKWIAAQSGTIAQYHVCVALCSNVFSNEASAVSGNMHDYVPPARVCVRMYAHMCVCVLLCTYHWQSDCVRLVHVCIHLSCLSRLQKQSQPKVLHSGVVTHYSQTIWL